MKFHEVVFLLGVLYTVMIDMNCDHGDILETRPCMEEWLLDTRFVYILSAHDV